MRKIIFFVGESGSGKSTMINYLINKYEDYFYYVKSTVTRAPRDGEVDGVNYHFVSGEEFERRDMVQTVEFGGNRYGTEVSEFKKSQPVGLIAVTPEGINDIRNGLDKLNMPMDYEVFFFNSTDEILKSRGVDEARLARGNLRAHFLKELGAGSFRNLQVTTVVDDKNLNEKDQIRRNEYFVRMVL